MSKQSVLRVVVLPVLLLGATACGGDDDVTIDAPPPMIDARPPPDAPPMIDSSNTNPPAAGLGQVCGAEACPAGMMPTYHCVTLDADTSDGLCTTDCGTSADMMTAPTGGDAICAAAYSGSVGMPKCSLYDPASPTGMVTWSCGVLCPDGQCPGGLECVMGLCSN